MWFRIVMVSALVTSACSTSRGALQGMGIGAGMFVGGLVAVGTVDERGAACCPDDPRWLGGLLIGASGVIVLGVSLIALIPLSINEADAKQRAARAAAWPRIAPHERADEDAVAPPGLVAPRQVGPIPIPPGTTIRAEGSVCTGKLDRCAEGLACVAGRCARVSPN